MKFLYTTTLFFFSVSIAIGQDLSAEIDNIVNQNRVQLEKVDTENLNNCILITSEFADEILAKEELRQEISELTIVKAYYVYTLYKLSPAFNQKELDRTRFTTLGNAYPELIQDRFFEWELLEQTGCTDYSEGDEYFHGFILVYRPTDEVSLLDEFNRLSNFFNDPDAGFEDKNIDPVKEQVPSEDGTTPSKIEDTDANYLESEYELYQYFKLNLQNSEIGLRRYDKWVDVNFEVNEEGEISTIEFLNDYPVFAKESIETLLTDMPAWNPATSNGEKTTSTVNLSIRVSYSPTVKGMYKRDGKRPTFSDQVDNPEFNTDEPTTSIPGPDFTDPKTTSTYIAIDEYVTGEKKMSLVMDVTGSMAPYIAAITRWVLANYSDHPFTSFTFFNDGDNKPTHKKKIGSAGGVYFSGGKENIRAAIKNAMVNGTGGERPENDIEAILVAQEEDEKTDEIMLLGDNWSEVRDLKLLNTVFSPTMGK